MNYKGVGDTEFQSFSKNDCAFCVRLRRIIATSYRRFKEKRLERKRHCPF